MDALAHVVGLEEGCNLRSCLVELVVLLELFEFSHLKRMCFSSQVSSEDVLDMQACFGLDDNLDSWPEGLIVFLCDKFSDCHPTIHKLPKLSHNISSLYCKAGSLFFEVLCPQDHGFCNRGLKFHPLDERSGLSSDHHEPKADLCSSDNFKVFLESLVVLHLVQPAAHDCSGNGHSSFKVLFEHFPVLPKPIHLHMSDDSRSLAVYKCKLN